MTSATDTEIEIAPAHPLTAPLACAAACVALADWLFYGWPMGISLALFLAALGIVAITVNRTRSLLRRRVAIGVAFIAALIAPIEDVNILSSILAVLATALFVIVTTAADPATWQREAFEAATAPLRGPFQLAADLFWVLLRMRRGNPAWLKIDSLVAWVVPLSLFAVFLYLFASANPLIENGLMRIDLGMLFKLFDPWRLLFWILVAGVIWPLILRRYRSGRASEFEAEPAEATDPNDWNHLFGARAISRSLVLFNALFALQTWLDLAYLWGGMNLPDGMSHAEYAHRGAYPLIVTALLAAGFALIAMRPRGPAQHSRLIRPLVLLWTGQNVLLVVSSMLRLDLYVAAFSLTYLRLAALIWMVLVATGLALMFVQILLRKSNSWLVAANACALALVLYGCCFINAPRLVASYNLDHCREVGGAGPVLDLNYLKSLGSQALPAVELHVNEIAALRPIAAAYRLQHEQSSPAIKNWRAWGWRTWRLERYLANNPAMTPDVPDGGKG
jgi:Domain of unknown function (DUF4173)